MDWRFQASASRQGTVRVELGLRFEHLPAVFWPSLVALFALYILWESEWAQPLFESCGRHLVRASETVWEAFWRGFLGKWRWWIGKP
jgi:hypothetical protein